MAERALAVLALASLSTLAQEAAPLASAHNCTPDDRNGFHGCPTMAERNRTLALLQQCLLERRPARADLRARCGRLLGAPDAPSSQYDGSCGFRSRQARGWLATLHGVVDDCTHVLFTVILGGTDALRPPLRAPERLRAPGERWCAVAFVDARKVRPSPWRAVLSRYPLFPASGRPSELWGSSAPWYKVGVADRSIFHNTARTAKALRVSAMRLFPRANWTIYADGKLRMLKSAAEIVAQVRGMTDLPIITIEHPRYLDMDTEFARARRRVVFQGRAHWEEDRADIDRQKDLYAREGLFNRQMGNSEVCVFLENRDAPPPAWSGLEPPGARAVIAGFECA